MSSDDNIVKTAIVIFILWYCYALESYMTTIFQQYQYFGDISTMGWLLWQKKCYDSEIALMDMMLCWGLEPESQQPEPPGQRLGRPTATACSWLDLVWSCAWMWDQWWSALVNLSLPFIHSYKGLHLLLTDVDWRLETSLLGPIL